MSFGTTATCTNSIASGRYKVKRLWITKIDEIAEGFIKFAKGEKFNF